ncbi:uncharacterized protein LOC135461590 [Liolophura sinensis]|uniref:uncharacterized protein LOC135461590 n=1 Tax=Liolophura sinensis TaxID=3198878 RepID=UPI0031597A45
MTADSGVSTSRPHTPTSGFRERVNSSASSILSVDDIVKWAERTRVSSCRQSRQSTVEVVQSFMFRDPKRITRPQTCKERRLNLRERPLTARSLCSEPPAPVTTPVAFSTLDDEGTDEENDGNNTSKAWISQQCCELLGPSVCQQCAKNLRVQKQRQRYERGFRSLRASEKNFTTAVLMKKNMPHLTLSQIQDKVAGGKVSQQQLRRLHEVRESPEEIEKRRLEKEMREKELLSQRKPKGNYSLREMNRRLAEGDTGFRKKRHGRPSITETLFPSFVSPRKVKYDEPMFRVYYEPPLVAKHRQKSEPTFFAGSNFDYKLPDRLPDKLIFTKLAKEPEPVETETTSTVPQAEPLDYEATFIDSVDNLIKEHLERA